MNRSQRTFNAVQNQSFQACQAESAILPYTIDWAAALQDDTISTSTWSSIDGDVTIAGESNTATTATAKLSGTPGCYRVINTVVTAAGVTDERFVDLEILDNDGEDPRDYA